jgi:hypothetical protein
MNGFAPGELNSSRLALVEAWGWNLGGEEHMDRVLRGAVGLDEEGEEAESKPVSM